MIVDKKTVSFAVTMMLAAFLLNACAPAKSTGPAKPAEPEPPAEPDSTVGIVLEEITTTGSRAQPESGEPKVERAESFMRMMPGRTNTAAYAMAQSPAELLASTSADEVWIISKPTAAASVVDDEYPGSGTMMTRLPDREVPLPLKHTAVSAEIAGYVSTVNVQQRFENPYDSKIEAVYMFPLPEKAAVSEFLMTIGDRTIRGILREKEEAEEIYRAARAGGYTASLLTQHRPNIFEQKVANIEPGKSIDVDIRYFHTLKYEDGWYSFVFPTVVGPRFNPSYSTDPIPAVPETDTTTPSPAVRYLRPDERSGHDISIAVSIDAGVTIEEVRSTHDIVAKRPQPQQATVQLARNSTIPNRDFKVDFRVAGETMKSDLLTWVDPKSQQGYFTMMLYPPEATDVIERRNMEMVFVLDASGSMSGTPMQQAKDAVRAALDQLQPGDTFQIIRFSDNASQFGPDPVLATPENIGNAKHYLNNLHGGGGTHMIEGLRAALDFPHDPERFRFVSFLTDGYIGNEVQILAEINHRLGDSRIFSFGVGSSVNRYLMERMASVGNGAVAYLGPQDSGYDIMAGFFKRVSHPALTDVKIDWNGMAVSDVYPSKLPDLFVGRPLVVTGTFVGAASPVTVAGRAGNAEHKIVIQSDGEATGSPALAKLWARLRIAELANQQAVLGDPANEYSAAIRDTALRYQLMSDYTSFVAVDSSHQTAGDHGTTVHQAVPVPDGVRYDTTVNTQGGAKQ